MTIFRQAMKIFLLFLPTLLLSHSIMSFDEQHSYQYQSHQSIMTAAKTYLKEQTTDFGGKITIEVSPLDHRLRLNHCDDHLETFSPPGANEIGKTTVGVRCNSPNPWTLYVSANVKNKQPVVVTLRDLHRSAVINSDDVRLDERDTSGLLRGRFDSLSEVIGRTLRRSIRRNQVVTPGSLVAEKTIKRGQAITILAGNKYIQVRMKGKALRTGNPGDLIPVQNLTSKKKLEARVISAGTVRID
jgi:flagella basal body P-ring formation protein FlgA